MSDLLRTVDRATATASRTAILLSANPMHDTGGGQRSAQIALELLEREWAVVFVSHGRVTEKDDLALEFAHERLVEVSLKEFLGRRGQRVRIMLERAGLDLVVTQVPVRRWIPVVDWARQLGATTVYDCVDRWGSELGRGWYRISAERAVARHSDLLFASARELAFHIEELGESPAKLLPNAYNDRIFKGPEGHERPADLPPGRTALYVGALWGGWMDWGLVERVAEWNRDTRLVFIGDRRGVPRGLPEECLFLGLKAQDELPAYLEHAEVGFLPWAVGPITRATSPLKVYEYVAMGLPVVAPVIEPLQGIPGVVRVDGDEAIHRALSSVGRSSLPPDTTDAMRSFSEGNSWRARVDELERCVAGSKEERRRAAAPRARAEPAGISVVIPSYNHERFLGEALESVKAQTLQADDLVVVDDGSTDGSLERVRAVDGDRLRLYTQPNRGAHAAINRAIALARGEWVGILNSDDLFLPERLEHAWGLARTTGAALILGGVEWVDAHGEPLPEDHPGVSWYREALAETNGRRSLLQAVRRHNVAVTTSNFFLHRSLWRALGGFRDYRYVHDLDFLIRALELCADQVVFEPSMVGVRYRVHGGNTIQEDSNRPMAERRSLIRALRRPGAKLRRRVESLGVASRIARATVEDRSAPLAVSDGEGPVRVGLVARALGFGGLEETVALLARHLPGEGIEPFVLCTHEGGDTADRLRRAGIDVSVASGKSPEWRAWVEEKRIQLASTHFADPGVVQCLHAAGVPIVETVQNAYAWFRPEAWHAEREKAAICTASVAVSELVARYHAERTGTAPTRWLVPNAVDPRRAAGVPRAWSRKALGFGDREVVFVHHGRFARQKNLPGLVRAFARAVPDAPDAHLLLVGPKGDRRYERETRSAAPELFRNGRIRREPSWRQVGTLLSAADVFVSNSFFEGWSVSASEAAWNGLPVVLSECGGSRELVGIEGRWGRLVPNPAGDPMEVDPERVAHPPEAAREVNEEALARALLELVRDRASWQRRRSEIRAQARERLGPERQAAAYGRVFRSTLETSA